MRIAIVGGGISGLTAAYLLKNTHRVDVFEASSTPGGHTYTVEVEDAGRQLLVDMGFIVFNERTYPQFMRLLKELGVAAQRSDMSFSVRCDRTGLEYNGGNFNQLFAQRRNLLRPSFYRMLLGIMRFHREAPQLLTASPQLTLGEFLQAQRYSRPFIEQYLIPMAASIWSTEPARLLEYPARTMAAFLSNHGMLSVDNRPQWLAVRGSSRRYLEALQGELGARLRTGQAVATIRRLGDSVEVRTADGGGGIYDHVVLATHSDQALRLLSDLDDTEGEILSAIPYQDNEAVLHTDRRLLPRRRRAWASWNYHLPDSTTETIRPSGVQLTYYMNLLQSLDSERDYCVTLNRTAEIDPSKILHRCRFAHPLFTRQSIAAQERWGEISGRRRTHFCGAYWGFGFHEDGVVAAQRVASQLGVEC